MEEGLEDSIYMSAMVGELVGKEPASMPIVVYTDNKRVREVILPTKMVGDKRLRLDIASIKESVTGEQNIRIERCPGKLQLANCLPKRAANPYDLILQSGQLAK